MGDAISESVSANIDLGRATKLVEGVKLPAQPKIVLMINNELQKAEPSFARIGEYVEQDAALSAKVLKIVNSPFYNSGKKVDSLKRAVTRLGVMNFYSIVLVSCLRDVLGRGDPAKELLWEHTEYVAKMCSHLAKTSRTTSPEYAYMLGLFHDSALPILLDKFPGYRDVFDMEFSRGGEIEVFESENFASSHAVIGYMLAKSWGLPAEIIEAIHHHHADNLDIFSNAKARKLGAVIILIDHMARNQHACVTAESCPTEPKWPRLFEQIKEELGLDEDALTALWEHGGNLQEIIA